MSPQQLALYAMVVLGFAMGGAAILLAVRAGSSQWKAAFMGVFAVLLLGVGAFGPSFLDDYGEFLAKLSSLNGPELEEAYASMIEDMATGDMPREYRSLAKAYMLQRPTANFDRLVTEGLQRATSAERATLSDLKVQWDRKQETATLAAKSAAGSASGTAPPADSLRALDDTSLLVLSAKPKAELDVLKINPAILKQVLSERDRIRTPR